MFKLKEIIKDKVVVIPFILGIVLFLFNFIFLIFNIQPNNYLYIIHYRVLRGIDLFGSWFDIYYLIFVSGFILIINLLLIFFFWNRLKKLSYFFIFSLPVLQIIILLSVINLILMNR